MSLALHAGCYNPPQPQRFTATLVVVDEEGAGISGALVDVGGAVHRTNHEGRATLTSAHGPMLAVIEAEGFLSEPVAVGHADAGQTVRVRMLSDEGGTRWVMHSAGDVMMGRRYELQDDEDDEPLVPAEDAAGGILRVVEPLRRAFAAADLGVVNLETVLSDQPPSAAYPGKRVVLHSRSETVAGLEALGVDVAVMANDHVRDYLDDGILRTMSTLAGAGIRQVGATGAAALPADAPAVIEAGGVRVGVLAWTTVDGASDNDDYPAEDEAMPADLAPEDAWRYEERRWWFRGPTLNVPAQRRRIGAAWRVFAEAEPTLEPAEVRDAWESLVLVYPELQDWVAQRGHGGAAQWNSDTATAAISALAASVDVVVVHLHSGYYGRPAPSSFMRRMAREAIDAGAGMVIGHHPHVLQGAEWYKGRLITYSLGNLLFDLESFDTGQTAFLRTVWEGKDLIEARLVLLELDGYRPKPVADTAARRTALAVWERSRLGAQMGRDADGRLHVFTAALDADTRVASVRMRHHDAVLEDAVPAVEEISLEVPAGETVPIGFDGLVFGRLLGNDLSIGRDLLGWGSFEDALADGEPSEGSRWRVNSGSEEVIVAEDAGAGVGYVRLRRSATNTQGVVVQPVSRIDLPAHRLYRDEDGAAVPTDGTARYTVRMLARLAGKGRAQVRLDLHYPGSESTRAELRIDVPADEEWHRVELELPDAMLFANGGARVEDVSLALQLLPPAQGTSWVDIDDLAIIEWRRAGEVPERYGAYDFVHSGSARDQTVGISGLPLRSSGY